MYYCANRQAEANTQRQEMMDVALEFISIFHISIIYLLIYLVLSETNMCIYYLKCQWSIMLSFHNPQSRQIFVH